MVVSSYVSALDKTLLLWGLELESQHYLRLHWNAIQLRWLKYPLAGCFFRSFTQ